VPLALIAGLRVLRVGDPAGWAVVDSVGHVLLGVPDLEVAFVPGMSTRMGRRTRLRGRKVAARLQSARQGG
jgi:hypothetical protein